MKAWVACDRCGDDWCNIHGMHAADCACPMHCEWTEDPMALEIENARGGDDGL